MRPIATKSLCLCLSLFVDHVRELCKTAEPIEMQFGAQ